MASNILRADWIRRVLPLILTIGVVGAAVGFAFSG